MACNSSLPLLLWFFHWVLCVDYCNFFFIPLLHMDMTQSCGNYRDLSWELPLLFDNCASPRTSFPFTEDLHCQADLAEVEELEDDLRSSEGMALCFCVTVWPEGVCRAWNCVQIFSTVLKKQLLHFHPKYCVCVCLCNPNPDQDKNYLETLDRLSCSNSLQAGLEHSPSPVISL